MEQLEKAGFAQSQRVSNLVDKARPWFLGSLMFPVTETQLLIVINHTNSLQNGIRRSLQGLQRTRPDPRMHTLIVSIAHQEFVCTQSSIFSRCAKSDGRTRKPQHTATCTAHIRAGELCKQRSSDSRSSSAAAPASIPRSTPRAFTQAAPTHSARSSAHVRTQVPTLWNGTERRGPKRPGPSRQVRFDTLQEHLDFRPGCGRVPPAQPGPDRPGPARPVTRSAVEGQRREPA